MSQTSISEVSFNSSVGAYYSTFWKSEGWGGREPNHDERARLDVINKLIDQHVYRGQPLAKILDVGCGRGWLTHQVRKYGSAHGLEAVPEAVEIARQTFPDLRFSVADLTRLNRAELEQFGHADLIVCSEVVEHVLDREKPQFFGGLSDL